MTKAAGLWNTEPRWGAGCSFVDYDRDGHLDSFVSNYIRFDVRAGPRARREQQLQLEGHSRARAACAASRTAGTSLYRNNGDGTFTDVSQRAGHRRRGAERMA